MYQEFLEKRKKLIEENSKLRFDYSISLNEKEQKVNVILQNIFDAEKKNPKTSPTLNIYERQEATEASEAFKVLKKFPKGALLHAHYLAMEDINEFIKNSTYHQNCYYYNDEDSKDYINGQMKFFNKEEVPKGFVSVEEMRKLNENFDKELLKDWKMNANDVNGSDFKRWKKFQGCFSKPWSVYWFRENFEKNFEIIMNSLIDDNIQYMETNTGLGEIYDLKKKYSPEECAQIFFDLNKKFVLNHENDFLGIKLCHENVRIFDSKFIKTHMLESLEIQKKYPNFVIGYDLVGQEDGPGAFDTLHYMEANLEIQEKAKKEGVDFQFFFHGGESLSPVENLFDLILLGTKRIGHGFNLFRYPKLYDCLKKEKICLEICPISNHVIGYVKDLRNHHAIGYMANDIPIVLCSDDPGIMGYTGMTHDFFVAAIYWNLDLRGIKKLALNSIEFISGSQEEKEKLREMWNKKYEIFLNYILHEFTK
eukprot:gene3562-6297_t